MRRHWKIIRDMTERKYSRHKVLKQIESRVTDSLNFIDTQEKYADLIVHHQLKTDATAFLHLQGDSQINADYETKIICINPMYYDCIKHEWDMKKQLKKCLIKAMKK